MQSHSQARIGLIEDDPIMGESIAHRLDLEGYQVDWWPTGREALQSVRQALPDLMICDIRLPDMNGESLFDKVIPDAPGLPFLFITGYAQVDQAVRLIRAGAADYVAKPFAMPDFLAKVEALVRRREIEEYTLGRSAGMRRLADLVRRVANIDSTVLFTGESGSGKEVAARFLHTRSDRAAGPFIAVNCAAIPRELLESELFGHERGAFTGAVARHVGFVERASGGILFLDEIGDLPLALQAKLLRLLEARRFQRVGGERELTCDARIICATNVDLKAAAARGEFRQDLLFRICVIEAHIPPLRQRPEDITLLLDHFRAEFSAMFGRHVAGYQPGAMNAAMLHSWPGNVRELRNRVERAVALAEGVWIGPEDLFPDAVPDAVNPASFASLATIRDQVERQHIRNALDHVGGKVEEAAKLLGVSRSTLFEKMRRLKLEH
ncbi:sigma-54-dependent transcriptional regulator [Dongia sedimenti]|uniref:Sigma-54 dependent transcriptional regulator n=1 Tax=Dongia sedimenti TaxID=3064282 RepID=A0ABU0YPK9_9PROT|nr:sigma-54 dependent transcriptional regulator [Rhodospirillaceae bacterium R-7]